jgi:nucleoside-diphosphate-sugar epimerase
LEPTSVIILGCGFTGSRVAELLLSRGIPTLATTSRAERIGALEARGLRALEVDVNRPKDLDRLRRFTRARSTVLHSVPLVTDAEGRLFDPTPLLLDALGEQPSRVVYLSTTGVYGARKRVDETTPVEPVTKRARLRVEAERTVLRGSWESLILRPAAIYGPGRGVHVAVRAGRHPLVGDGSNYVSRIHVDDLAAHACAALFSDVTGSYPVADDEPCTSKEITAFCARLLGIPMPPSVDASQVSETRRADRRVDGTAIRRLLGVKLRFPSFRTGIPACLEVERDCAEGPR